MSNLKIYAAKKNLKKFVNFTFLKYFLFWTLILFSKTDQYLDSVSARTATVLMGSLKSCEWCLKPSCNYRFIYRARGYHHWQTDTGSTNGSAAWFWVRRESIFFRFFHHDALHKKCTHCVISSAKCKMIVIIQLEAKNWKHLWKWCNANMPWPEAIIHRIELFMWRKVSDLWRDFTVNS